MSWIVSMSIEFNENISIIIAHRPNAIQDMTLHKIGQFSKLFKLYNEALPWYNGSYTAG